MRVFYHFTAINISSKKAEKGAEGKLSSSTCDRAQALKYRVITYATTYLDNLKCSNSFFTPLCSCMPAHAYFHRSIPVPGRLPVTLKAPKASGGCTSRILSSTQAAGTTAALAVGESGSLDTEDDHSAIATGGDGMSDEVVALHELISTQKGDLETAALIGQRLLDATDELSAKLEVSTGVLLVPSLLG